MHHTTEDRSTLRRYVKLYLLTRTQTVLHLSSTLRASLNTLAVNTTNILVMVATFLYIAVTLAHGNWVYHDFGVHIMTISFG
jgi:small neutral amino acid transporter SnatA (MarC family)